jgi:hypothetical protein
MFLGGLFEAHGGCDDVFHENATFRGCVFLKDCGKFKKGDKVDYISYYPYEAYLIVAVDKSDKDGCRIELSYCSD